MYGIVVIADCCGISQTMTFAEKAKEVFTFHT